MNPQGTAVPPAPTAEVKQRADARRNRKRDPGRRPRAVRRARASTSRWSGSPAPPESASGPSTGTSRPRRTCSRPWPTSASPSSRSGRARRSRIPMPGTGSASSCASAARVTAEDRALSEAMDQLPGLCGAAAEKVDLNELDGELIERAKADGAMRADFSVDDIPSMMCGLARATASHGGAPTRDELGALPGDHHRRPSRAGQPAASVSSPAYELARGRVGRACGAAPRRRVGDLAAGRAIPGRPSPCSACWPLAAPERRRRRANTRL